MKHVLTSQACHDRKVRYSDITFDNKILIDNFASSLVYTKVKSVGLMISCGYVHTVNPLYNDRFFHGVSFVIKRYSLQPGRVEK